MWSGFIELLYKFLGAQIVAAEGAATSGASAIVATGQNGPGTLQVINTDPSAIVYLAGGGRVASAASFPLPAGASVSWPLADVSSVTVFGTGQAVGWAVLRAP